MRFIRGIIRFLAALATMLIATMLMAAYVPIIGTTNHVTVTSTVGGLQIDLTGPYTPTTLTLHGFLFGAGTGSITSSAEPSNGQLPIGNTGNVPTLATLTAGVGIAVSNGAGSITIKAVGNQCAARASSTTPITIATTDCLFLGSATGGADQVVNLPVATGTFNHYCIKKQDSNAHNIAVTPNGTDTIDGVNSADNLGVQYQVHCYDDYGTGTWAIL